MPFLDKVNINKYYPFSKGQKDKKSKIWWSFHHFTFEMAAKTWNSNSISRTMNNITKKFIQCLPLTFLGQIWFINLRKFHQFGSWIFFLNCLCTKVATSNVLIAAQLNILKIWFFIGVLYSWLTNLDTKSVKRRVLVPLSHHSSHHLTLRTLGIFPEFSFRKVILKAQKHLLK